MNRREFIKQTAQAAIGASVIGGGVLLLGQRGIAQPSKPQIFTPKNYRTVIDPNKPALAAAKSKNWRSATAAAIAALGGIEAFVKKGDYVCLKPNIGWDRTPEQGANTHPDIVAEIVKLCFKAGAGRVVVTDVSCNEAERTFNRSGVKAAAIAEGAEVILEDYSVLTPTDFGPNSLGEWPVLDPVLLCDKLINIPVIKHHSLSGMTAGFKNWFGAMTGPRNRLHQGIDQNLVELARLFTPTLTVIDATRVLQRNGPTGGNINDVTIYDTVVASTDQVAIEAYVTRYLNKSKADFPYIAAAEKMGLGISELSANKIAELEV